MKIGFKLKNPNKSHSSLFSEFKINNQQFKFYPGKTVQVQFWSKTKQAVLSGHKNYQEINLYLKTYKEDLEKIILSLQTSKIRLDKDRIQAELDKLYKVDVVEYQNGEVKDFISFMDQYITTKVGRAYSTIQVLKQTRKFVIMAFQLVSKKDLVAYNKLSPKSKSATELTPNKLLDFESINIGFFEEFQGYMFSAKFKTTKARKDVYLNYKKNYIGKQIKILKQFVDAAIEKGYVANFKFTSIKAPYEDIDSVYTDINEIQKFLNLKLDPASVEEITRNKYVVNCFLGLRYSDLSKLQDNFFTTQRIDGVNQIIYKGRAVKTDRKVEFVVHPTAVAILKKYKFQLPAIAEQTYNECLKKIALMAGLTGLEHIRETRGAEKLFKDVPKYTLISSHTGRRSYCTNMFMAGVPMQAIMSVSGHKSEREFLKYINKSATVNIGLVAQQVNTIKPLLIY